MKIKNLAGWTIALLAVTGLAAALSGCAGYQLGSMLPPDIKTVFVPTFVNNTTEPLIEVDTTQAAVQEFQRDGSLKVVNEEQADAILEVILYDYSLSPLAYREDRETAANEYRVTILASLVMKRRVDDTVIAESPRVRGEATFDVVGDLSSSKATALQAVSEDLAHKIVETVVETW